MDLMPPPILSDTAFNRSAACVAELTHGRRRLTPGCGGTRWADGDERLNSRRERTSLIAGVVIQDVRGPLPWGSLGMTVGKVHVSVDPAVPQGGLLAGTVILWQPASIFQ